MVSIPATGEKSMMHTNAAAATTPTPASSACIVMHQGYAILQATATYIWFALARDVALLLLQRQQGRLQLKHVMLSSVVPVWC
jgi:hypothetical protein